MKLSAPKKVTFIIALVLAVLGLVGKFVAVLSPYSFWLVLVGFILLAAGVAFDGI